MEIDKSKLTFRGSMNYIVQVFDDESDPSLVTIDQYQPRKNKVYSGTMSKREVKEQIRETIERMKIAIGLFEEYLEGKREYVYYWELENEETD